MSDPRAKQSPLIVRGKAAPDEGQLAAIRRYTMPDFDAAEQLYVRTFVIAHNAIDRDRETFDEALLADFARTLPGKGAYIKHPNGWDGDSGPAEGRWFEASLQRMSLDEARALLREPSLKFPPDRTEATVLVASAYFVRTDENKALLAKVDAGIAGDVSVGFTAARSERVKDGDGRELNVFRLFAPGEALEASLVWLGAQPGARAVKSAPRKSSEAPNVDENTQVLQTKVTDLTTQLAEQTKGATAFAAVRKALGDNGALLDTPDQLADIVAAGKAHRDDLVDRIVAAERVLGIVGDDEGQVKSTKAVHAQASTANLLALAKHYEARAPKGSQLPGGDPNTRPPAADTTKAPGPFASALL